MVVKTYRGLLADGGQDQIRLSTIKGKVGYRINKFQIIGNNPQTEAYESVLKIYSLKQTTIDGVINFTDTAVLGAAFLTGDHAPSQMFEMVIIADQMLFNQDIFITHHNTQGNAVNYYIELEVIPLTDQGAEYTTLKDLRARS